MLSTMCAPPLHVGTRTEVKVFIYFLCRYALGAVTRYMCVFGVELWGRRGAVVDLGAHASARFRADFYEGVLTCRMWDVPPASA